MSLRTLLPSQLCENQAATRLLLPSQLSLSQWDLRAAQDDLARTAKR
jgi:hypothetical protein